MMAIKIEVSYGKKKKVVSHNQGGKVRGVNSKPYKIRDKIRWKSQGKYSTLYEIRDEIELGEIWEEK